MLRDVQYFGVQTLRQEEAQHTADQVLRGSKLASVDDVMRVRVALHASKDCPPSLAHAGCPTHAEMKLSNLQAAP